MGLIKIEIDDNTKRRLWKKSIKKFGFSESAMSLAVKEAINKWLRENESDEIDVERERLINNLAYQKLESELYRKYKGKFVVIANGELIAVADSYDDIMKIANKKAPNAKHRLIFKVEEKTPRNVTRLGWRIERKRYAKNT